MGKISIMVVFKVFKIIAFEVALVAVSCKTDCLRDIRGESSEESASEMDVEVRFMCGSIFD